MEQSNQFLKNIYLKALLPNIIVILGDSINILVDSVLVGQKIGDWGMAAINQTLPVYLFLSAIGSLFAIGASTESARALGEKDKETAKKYFSIAVEGALFISMLVCAIGLLCTPLLAEIFGSDMSRNLLQTYMGITFLGGVFQVLMYIPYYYLPLEGNMNQSVLAMTLMTMINMILDYVFLFYTDWGIAGAAGASVIASMVACILSFQFLMHKSDVFQFEGVRPAWEEMKKIVQNGKTLFVNHLFSAVRMVALNWIMNLAGGSSAVTIFAITNNLNECSACIQNGIPQTAHTLMMLCKEEKDNKALKNLLKVQIKSGFVISGVILFFVVSFSDKIGFLFGSHLDVQTAIVCWAVSLGIAIFNNIMTGYYYAIKEIQVANGIMLLRHFAIITLVAWFMKDMGNRLWFFYPIAEVLTLFIWTICVKGYTKWKKKQNLLFMEETQASIELVVGCQRRQIYEVSAYANDFCEEIGLNMQQTMMLRLAVEELLMIIAEKTLHNEGIMEIRILKIKNGAILRIRSEGEPFNPLEYAEEDMDFMGLLMVRHMAVRTAYKSTLGLNTLIVEV